MGRIRGKNTSPELIVRRVLHAVMDVDARRLKERAHYDKMAV